ncbi:hypothetical protein BDF21DRAFT_453663 [Thamnidium elegans]|nr:hypothetical protein BDF21DRAFT_453663 [Thamnidium elegans]
MSKKKIVLITGCSRGGIDVRLRYVQEISKERSYDNCNLYRNRIFSKLSKKEWMDINDEEPISNALKVPKHMLASNQYFKPVSIESRQYIWPYRAVGALIDIDLETTQCAIKSNFATAGTNHVPEDPLYISVSKYIIGRASASHGPGSTSTDIFAAHVVKKILEPVSPAYITFGPSSWTCIAMYYFPVSVRYFVLSKMFGVGMIE